jgi:hypothetical protein
MTPLVLALMIVAAVTASAQTARQGPETDKEKIADALRAGPTFITKDATLLDWPSTPTGDYRVLRKGTTEWTCLPGFPDYPHDEPGCFDQVFLQWIKDSLAGRLPHVDTVGIAYMYAGAWIPHKAAVAEPPDQYFHVGPHIMIVTPNQNDLRAFSTDGTNGMSYVNHLPGRNDMFLVIPIREWDEKPR